MVKWRLSGQRLGRKSGSHRLLYPYVSGDRQKVQWLVHFLYLQNIIRSSKEEYSRCSE
jgi:hypothetical protein